MNDLQAHVCNSFGRKLTNLIQDSDHSNSTTKFVSTMAPSQVGENTLPTATMPQNKSPTTIPTIRVVDADDAQLLEGTRTFPDSSSPTSPSKPAQDLLEEDMDRDPQAHFLSPVQRYEAWDDSDDEEDDGIEWDAGIVDFALFSEDQKRAKAANQPLPSKWNDLLSNQAAAYQRSVERTNDETSEPEFLSRTSSGDSLPDLTPDTSPRLKDNLEYEDDEETPPYRTVIVTPESVSANCDAPKKRLGSIEEEDSAIEDEDEDVPLSFALQRSKLRRRQSMPQPPRKLVRPGLRSGRTLSGKLHVWRRPSWDIWPVLEDASGEARAENGGEVSRGRCRLPVTG